MSPSFASFRRPPLRLALAIVFAAATLLYGALWMAAVRAAPDVELGYQSSYQPAEQAQLVTSVQPDSPGEQCGMRPGDRLVAIDGQRLADVNFQARAWFRHEPGDTVRLTIRRPGDASPIVLTCTFRRTSSTSTEGGVAAYVAGQVRNSYPVPFVVVGLAVLFLRLDDPKAWLLALLFAAFTATPGFPDSMDAVAPALRPFARAYQAIFLSLLAPSFYIFFAVFPARSPVDRRLPWLKWVTLAVAVAVALPGLRAGGMRPPPPLPRLLGANLANQIVVYWALAILTIGLVSLAANYVHPPEAETRRKIRVIVWGTAVGLTPNLIDAGVRQATGLRDPDWLATLLVLVAFLIPLSLAYAVVKHRVLEIPVLLKRSARYLLVQRGFTILLALVSMAVTAVFALWLVPSLAPLVAVAQPSGIAMGAVFGTMLLWGGTQIHRRVSERIDRAFFRRAYDTRMILQELADRTRAATGRAELAALLHRHVGDALQPSALAVYLRERDGRLTALAGDVPTGLERLPEESPALAALAGRGRPVDVSAAPPGGEDNLLTPLAPDYVVPMVGRDRRLVGLVVLGPRLSEEPYSGEDVRLLALVAGQAALALENLSLAEQMADRIEADRRQAHEVAIAQEVQQKLLPQRKPPLRTLDYAGACIQARVVGGDYYDFLDLGPGRVGFVLADISGKGIAGALLMANLQAIVRSHYAMAATDHEGLLRSVNRLFFASTAPNRFATMFFATYDDATREIVYVNCGHNPPLLLREGGDAEWLAPTATALGFFDGWTCTSGTRRLAPGDVLVMYSDGITEAWSEAGEEYGDDRLLAVVRAGRRLPAADLVGRIVADVERFSPVEHSDDWTLIALRAE